MKRRVLLLLGVIVIGCLGAAIWIFSSSDPVAIIVAEHLKDQIRRGDKVSQPVNLTDENAQGDKQAERVLNTFNAIESTNQPIDFWGRVLDQDDRPIADVKVHFSYSIEHGTRLVLTWGRQENRSNDVMTDAMGDFYISGIRGHILEIESLTKTNYEFTKRRVLNYDYYGSTSEGRFRPSKDKPTLFAMVEKGNFKDITKYGEDLRSGMEIIGNGVPVRWDIAAGKPDPSGEIQFTFKRNPVFLSDPSQRSEWELKIELIGGGIMESSPDDVIYRAPEEGYLPSIYYPKLEQKRGYQNREFYFKIANNNYGRLQLNLYADDEGESSRLYIQSWLNSSGGRLLEAGPNR